VVGLLSSLPLPPHAPTLIGYEVDAICCSRKTLAVRLKRWPALKVLAGSAAAARRQCNCSVQMSARASPDLSPRTPCSVQVIGI